MIIDVNGVPLFYKCTGSGRPLILLHGNGEDHSIFDSLATRLADDFTIYAVDSRNHGLSGKTGDYSYRTMSEDIYAFIVALGLGKAGLLGFSDGAIISLMLAMNHAEIVLRMALLGVNLCPEDFTEESYRYIRDTYEETKDPLFRLMLEEPQIELDSLCDLAVPTLLVAGENDIYKPSLYTDLAKTLPDARLKIMPGHDHSSYIIGSDILYPDLSDFFTEIQ